VAEIYPNNKSYNISISADPIYSLRTMDGKREALEKVFSQFDKDGSGSINAAELKSALREYNMGMGQTVDDTQMDQDVQTILAACDSSKDGKIDKKEFFQFFQF